MQDVNVISLMPPDALRALAHYYECTAAILRRRADTFDPPTLRNAPAEREIFLRLPESVAEKQRDGMGLDRAIDLVSVEYGTTRKRVLLAIESRSKKRRADRTHEQMSVAIEMRKAGASVMDIARRLRVRPARAERLVASADYMITNPSR